jgi:hypothetical protein
LKFQFGSSGISAKRLKQINMPRQIFQELYETIFRMNTSIRAKVVCLEDIAHEDERFQSWLVVGITKNALKALADVGFRVPEANIRRAHKVSRRDRGNELFNRVEPMPNAYDFFFEHDSVTLTTAAENKRPGCEHWSKEYPLDLSDLQRGRTPFAALGTRAEIERVRALHDKNRDQPD